MPPSSTTRRCRRSPCLVAYWQRGALILHHGLTNRRIVATPFIVEVLDACRTWRADRDLERLLGGASPSAIRTLVTRLLRLGLLEESSGRREPAAGTLMSWWDATPEPAFFHLTTKDMSYVPEWPREAGDAAPRPPAPLKRYRHTSRTKLPLPDASGQFLRVLQERRTWRRFGTHRVTLGEIGTLLGLTFGVQGWLQVGPGERVALKTSPSGGARHSIEAYVLAVRVEGLAPGLYHFAPDDHRLDSIRRGASRRDIAKYLPTQHWYEAASALVFMTSVFDRVRARYPYPRSYRCILAESGHLCQTFCLTATRLGLAPFCTMAFADSVIERDLGVDGLNESIVYVAGVGTRPKEPTWTPWQETTVVR